MKYLKTTLILSKCIFSILQIMINLLKNPCSQAQCFCMKLKVPNVKVFPSEIYHRMCIIMLT